MTEYKNIFVLKSFLNEYNFFDLVTRMERREERVVGSEGQDPLLRHGALHVIVLNDNVFLEDLNGEHLKQKIESTYNTSRY